MTAVITKYEADFKRWVEAHPDYPEPVWISKFVDLKDRKFIYVRQANNHAKILLHKKLIEECNKRIITVIGMITTSEAAAKKNNAVIIDSLKKAKEYYYADIIIDSRKRYLPDQSIAILCECESRYVRLTRE